MNGSMRAWKRHSITPVYCLKLNTFPTFFLNPLFFLFVTGSSHCEPQNKTESLISLQLSLLLKEPSSENKESRWSVKHVYTSPSLLNKLNGPSFCFCVKYFFSLFSHDSISLLCFCLTVTTKW